MARIAGRDLPHDGGRAVPRTRGQVLPDAAAQRDSQADPEAASAAVDGLLAPGDDRDGGKDGRGRADVRLPVARRRAEVDPRLLSRTLEDCHPVAYAVNPNVGFLSGFICNRDGDRARQLGVENSTFFGYCFRHYYVDGVHQPGETDLWEQVQEHPARPSCCGSSAASPTHGCIGTPDEIRKVLLDYEAAGVDQVIFIAQAGKLKHEEICESFELFGKTIVPEFKERDEKHVLRESQTPRTDNRKGDEAARGAQNPRTLTRTTPTTPAAKTSATSPTTRPRSRNGRKVTFAISQRDARRNSPASGLAKTLHPFARKTPVIGVRT